MEKQISAEELVMWLHNNPAATDEEIRAQYDRLGKSDVAQLKRVMNHIEEPSNQINPDVQDVAATLVAIINRVIGGCVSMQDRSDVQYAADTFVATINRVKVDCLKNKI